MGAVVGGHDIRTSVELGEEDVGRLLAALRVDTVHLDDVLGQLAKAALEEWLDQILARRLPPRINDVRQVRLLHYALTVNKGQLPRPELEADRDPFRRA